jgi:hypothetical protein
MTKTQDTAPALDLSALSVSELAALLAKAREADKAKKAQESSLPMFAFWCGMTDSTLVQWAGRAVDYATAQDQAIAYAERNGGKVYRHTYSDGQEAISVSPRPIPGPRGRKAKATKEAQG